MAKKQFNFWQEVGCFGLFKLMFIEHHVTENVYRKAYRLMMIYVPVQSAPRLSVEPFLCCQPYLIVALGSYIPAPHTSDCEQAGSLLTAL